MEKCKFCQKLLTEKQLKRKAQFCSYSCINKYRYKDVQKEFTCLQCGKLYIKAGRGMQQGTKYCGRECAVAATLQKPTKSIEHRRKIGEAQKHIRIEGVFGCDRCLRKFDSNTAVRAHKAHCKHKKLESMCFSCKETFKGLAALQRHQVWCLNDTVQQDKIKKATSAANHRRIKDGKMKIGCFDTDIEVILEENFKANSIKYEKQFSFEGCNHCYDFYLPDYNLIVEADGDYWHGNPEKFETTDLMKKQYWCDVQYTKVAIEHGYKIIRFWGSDIKQRPKDCIDEALGYCGSKIIARKFL